MSGPLALVGGGEWRDGCDFDTELLAASGGSEVVVLPTAAAYEHPDLAVERATRWFEGAGATVRPVRAVDRAGAHDEAAAAVVRAARFVYLSDGSPMHLRSVLMQTPLWDAVVAAWRGGAVLAASGAGAMVLCDPAVDPRGGAFTVGLGLLQQLAVVPRADTWSEDKLHRTLQLTPPGVPLVEVDERTALIRGTDGTWRTAGAGSVSVWLDGHQADLEALPT
ncbi:MAG: Type 1 glutamine amidotransferase-like domain-containing protein [Acidimicrobiales bacterium]|nr:Type 1 glutamine amidotransferase-like domain-containing protein [Acidimicrobiales bacterium]